MSHGGETVVSMYDTGHLRSQNISQGGQVSYFVFGSELGHFFAVNRSYALCHHAKDAAQQKAFVPMRLFIYFFFMVDCQVMHFFTFIL